MTEGCYLKSCTCFQTTMDICGFVKKIPSTCPTTKLHGPLIAFRRPFQTYLADSDVAQVAIYFCIVSGIWPLPITNRAHTFILQSFTFSSREDARQYAGQLLAVVTCTMGENSFLNVIKQLNKDLDSEVKFIKIDFVNNYNILATNFIYESFH